LRFECDDMAERGVYFRVSISALLCAGLIAGCSRQASTPGPAPKASAAALSSSERNTSPPLEWKPGSHSAAVFDRMLQFRSERREKFKEFLAAYVASKGNVKYPRLARLKASVLKWFFMDDNDYAHLPAYMKVFEGTGPYRRLVTKPGYSYVAGTIFLPCKASRLNARFETAFAYVGGWGVGGAGKAVDAGFQRGDKFDDYAAFILAQDFPQISKYPRFACGHSVAFRFYAASDRTLRLWTRGVTTSGKVEVVVADLNHKPSYGWPPDGGGSENGIVLKRMTTIGQANADQALPDDVAWDANGSYFGHYANDRKPLVRWSNVVVGRVDAKGNPSRVVPWGVAESNLTFRAGSLNYPSDLRKIWFTCTACPDESNAIDLAKSRPRP
jgi:hypothetical protein